MQWKIPKEKPNKELQIMLRFLERTRDGKYAPIEESSLSFTRLKEVTESIESIDEQYYYGMS